MKTTSLAAILFCELAGFSDLLARDEARALALLDDYRRLVSPLVEEHGGEIVDATGDELLIVFGSAVGAVQCALHLRLSERSLAASRPPEERLSPRSGIHLGEIWRDDKRVYGNGVNVAARVKAEAGPGQILLSEDVYRQVVNKLDLPFRALPDRPLKNIERPLALYEIPDAAREAASATRSEGPAYAAPRPSAPPVSAPSPAPPLPSAPPPPEAPYEAPAAELPAPAGEAVGRALAREIASRVKVKVYRGEDEDGRVGFTIESGNDDEEASGDGDGTRPALPSCSADIERRKERARQEMAKGAKNFLFASAVGGAFLYFGLPTESVWLIGGAALFGLGPALSGLKRFVKGAFDLRDARKDARGLEDDRG